MPVPTSPCPAQNIRPGLEAAEERIFSTIVGQGITSSSIHLLHNHIRVILPRPRRSCMRSPCVGSVVGPGDILELLRRVHSSARELARRSTEWAVTPATIETPPALRTVGCWRGWRTEPMWRFRKVMECVAKRTQRRDHKGQQRRKDLCCIHTRLLIPDVTASIGSTTQCANYDPLPALIRCDSASNCTICFDSGANRTVTGTINRRREPLRVDSGTRAGTSTVSRGAPSRGQTPQESPRYAPCGTNVSSSSGK